MSIIDGARVRWREWREQVAEKKASRVRHVAADQLHGHSRFWLLNIPAMATLCAAVVEVYWAILFCIEATGHWDWNWDTAFGSGQPFSSTWNFAFGAHLPVLVGLICATAPIVMISMIWLPVQFAMRGYGRWRRGTMIAVGVLANILVIVSGTVVMNYNRQEQVRDALVVEQTAEAQRGVLTANVEALEGELATLMNHRSTYIATAASVGAEEYERGYVAQARATNDPRLPLLERALGAARRADTLRAEIQNARVTAAQAAPAAATAANVEDTVGAELNTFAQLVEVWRPPFIAVLCTLIGIFGAWWTLAMLEHMNPKDVLRSGWAPEELRIEDHSDEPGIKPQPMDPPREAIYDADTGEELVRRRATWARKPKRKGKPEKISVPIEARGPQEDERGVQRDGGARIAMTAAGPMEMASAAAAEVNAEPNNDSENADEKTDPEASPIQDTPPELSDDEIAAIDAELAAETPSDQGENAEEPPTAEETEKHTDDEVVSQHRSTPETDPKRMIGVAAE